MGALGGIEWLLVIVVLILFFGAKRIPGLARGIGEGIKEFRNARIDSANEKEE